MKLTIRHKGNSSLAGRTQEFERELVRIGRKPGNDVLFDPNRDPLVSANHAEIRVSAQQVTLCDLGSTNGTYVNGKRIAAPTPVSSRDRITFGNDGPELALEFSIESHAAAAAAPTLAMSASPPTMVGTSQRTLGNPDGAPSGQPYRGMLDDAVEAMDNPTAAMHPAGRNPTPAPAARPPMGLEAHPYDLPAGMAPGGAPPRLPGGAPPPLGDRPPSRASQGQYRPIGINTLMGVLDRSKKEERRRTVRVLLPVFLVLVVASVITAVYFSKAPPTVQWSAIFAKAEPSVYQIIGYERVDGREVRAGAGTAWSVKPGLLATNAHVAKIVEEVGRDGYVIARRLDKSHDLRIVKVRIHPGWEQCNTMLYDYRPFAPSEMSFMTTLGPTCDVALLEVHPDDISKQGDPLPLNLTDRITAGRRIGFVGFPAEGVSVNFDNPTPYSGSGEISKMMGLVLEEASEWGTEYFVGHSLATTGGASGSPILNEKGEVVAVNFAGDKQGHAEDGTRLSVAGHKYAIPIRLLQELIDGTVDANQQARRTEWAKTLQSRFESGTKDPMALMLVLAQQGRASYYEAMKAASQEIDPASIKLVKADSGVFNVNGTSSASVRIPGAGFYVLTVCGDAPNGDLSVDVMLGNERQGVNEISIDENVKRRVYYGRKTLNATSISGAVDLPIKLSTAGKPVKVTWTLFQVVSK